MGRMRIFRGRRVRRTQKQVLKHGTGAKRRHARPGGRTGRIMAKRLKGLK